LLLRHKESSTAEAYLADQMKKVSRSFALVVAQLEEPLQEQLAAAYLICRVVDNIEDCDQPFDWQGQRFAEFETLLREPSLAPQILARWDEESWPGLTEDEAKLMGGHGGALLWQIYSTMPAQAQASISRWTKAMAQGMARFEDPAATPHLVQRQGVWVLADVADYNEYCYYVAGTVGHLATELAVAFYGLEQSSSRVLDEWCEACGRGLQKTNIVKDFAKDVRRGISYIPEAWLAAADHRPLSLEGAPAAWTAMVINDVLKELRQATEYVLALPYSAAGYRMASLLCLLPAYETLTQAAERRADLFTADHQVKISRLTMMGSIRRAKRLLRDNDGVQAFSNRSEQTVNELLLAD
jgi:farnesyl-diphosphate farnesyltransferase